MKLYFGGAGSKVGEGQHNLHFLLASVFRNQDMPMVNLIAASKMVFTKRFLELLTNEKWDFGFNPGVRT